ncbi:DUF596 domain-containing protein [Burkholderia cepacia]|uniref:DUF596 domain-containing protein n=2 Tax=Burkholderia cepacia TaxID=292 RepID=A0A8I1DLB9_BURCE|nr:DUF596 domain-containing protein [Burkholderia cepacia]MBA9897003.1 DUF596 domain-containing protein [Burkholderia cepacia]MBA9942441.1 DUF596 domain-containing protein [Burkholderia cepacia]MBA9972554.1 DUF596 domain-containing protein [Burkholderia cepacia]MBA9991126.1 DUF596 domain-containing protein [Burkholderia cepacia]MBA9999642.1 DUF596 domain-containing protein [Burkholderia cepacia]
MLSDYRYKFIVSYVDGMALDAVWLYIQDDAGDYFERKSLFLWVLRGLLDERVIVAGKHGRQFSEKVDEIANMFESAFPESESGLDDGIWFFSEACPAGIGWIGQDGNVYWT